MSVNSREDVDCWCLMASLKCSEFNVSFPARFRRTI